MPAAKPAAVDIVKAGATAEKKTPGTTAAQVLQMGADAKKGAKAAEPPVKEGKCLSRCTFCFDLFNSSIFGFSETRATRHCLGWK